VSSDTIEETDTTAERLRNALVDQVIKERRVHTPRVKVTMRTVPRHVFVPEASDKEACANSTVDIKHNSDGTSISFRPAGAGVCPEAAPIPQLRW
jgi:protein-L-isoaspartate(D-aspartate) O-methyltransferase